jgi:hypothetical protein
MVHPACHARCNPTLLKTLDYKHAPGRRPACHAQNELTIVPGALAICRAIW